MTNRQQCSELWHYIFGKQASYCRKPYGADSSDLMQQEVLGKGSDFEESSLRLDGVDGYSMPAFTLSPRREQHKWNRTE
jgi:hypothetical protein